MWVDEIHNVHSSAKVKLSFPPFNSSLSLPPDMLLFFSFAKFNGRSNSAVASTAAILADFLFA